MSTRMFRLPQSRVAGGRMIITKVNAAEWHSLQYSDTVTVGWQQNEYAACKKLLHTRPSLHYL